MKTAPHKSFSFKGGWGKIVIEAPTKKTAKEVLSYILRKTLHLTVHKAAFEVMVTGEKPEEYRKPSQWMQSRLWKKKGEKDFEFYEPKEFEVVKITNGYRKDSPYFIAEFKGFIVSEIYFKRTYSNGLIVEVQPGDYILNLGKILEKKHCL